MYELEDYPIGSIVLTPLGRRAIVKRCLTGASKKDHFARLICQYEGGGTKDLVTLQPHQLQRAGGESKSTAASLRGVQMSQRCRPIFHTYGHANASEIHAEHL